MINRLTTQGNRIVDAVTRETVLLRGANLIRFPFKYEFGAGLSRDLDLMEVLTAPPAAGGWGANCVTLWIDSAPVLADSPEYLQWLDFMMQVAQHNDAYILWAWHAEEGTAGHPARPDARAVKAMARVARRFTGVPNAIFACQAEPAGGDHQDGWSQLRALQEQMIDAIRVEYPGALVGVAGTAWSQNLSWMLNTPVRRDNIFLKPHVYDKLPIIGSTLRLSQTYPLIIGEFGPRDDATLMQLADAVALINWADASSVGWQAWNFGEPGTTPDLLMADQDPFPPTEYGVMVRDALRALYSPPSGQEGIVSNTALLTVLPPRVVSINVTPTAVDIPAGRTQQYKAELTLSDGSIRDGTTEVTWVSSNESAAGIDDSGLAKGTAKGSTQITARLSRNPI